MKKVLGISLVVIIWGCGKAPQDKTDILPPDGSGKIYSSRKVPANMVDYIFSQMADTSADLKSLIDKDEQLFRDRAKWEEIIADYSKYEETYMKSAIELMQGHSFVDTVLRDQIYSGLERLKERHGERIQWIASNNAQVASLVQMKEDQWIALKVLLTMPVLEDYLTSHMPDSTAVNSLKNGYGDQIQFIRRKVPLSTDTAAAGHAQQ